MDDVRYLVTEISKFSLSQRVSVDLLSSFSDSVHISPPVFVPGGTDQFCFLVTIVMKRHKRDFLFF